MDSNPSNTKLVRIAPVAVTLIYALVAVVITHPLWLYLSRTVPGDIGDPLLNTWILAWDGHAFLTQPLQLFDANIFYPLPNTLAYSEHLASTAVLALPLQALSGEPTMAYNLSFLLSFPLAGLGMYLLVLRWTQRQGAAFLAGLAYAFAPYRFASFAHLQLLTAQWLPFSLLALDQLLGYGGKSANVAGKSRAGSRWVASAAHFVIFTALQVLASWYLAIFTALILALYTLSWLVAHWRRAGGQWGPSRSLARLAVATLLVIGSALPFVLPYVDVLPELQEARPLTWAVSFAAEPSDYLAAVPFLRVSGPLTQGFAGRRGFTEENTLFLGLAVSVLGLAGLLWGRPRWRTMALLATLAVSLIMTFGRPYLALTHLIPLLKVVRVPPRWVILATFALAALAGYGVQAIQPRAIRRAVVLAASLFVVIESFAAPLPLATVGSSADLHPVYRGLESLQGLSPGAVVELPMHVAPAPEYPETKRLYASTLGWWGLVNGYSGFTPERQVQLGGELAEFPAERALVALRDLGASGVRYLVVHPDEAPMDRDRWEGNERGQVEQQTTLLPQGRFGPEDLYLINPYGDDLITDPAIATDPFWLANGPAPQDIRFTLPGSDGEIRLLASLYQRTVAPELQTLDLGSEGAQPPLEGRLTLYWQASAHPDTDYTVFVHSLNAEGQMIGQADGPPVANRYPTTAWQPGEIVQDSRLVPGGSRYLVGLYDAARGERLPAFEAGSARLPDDAAVIVIDQTQ